MLNRNTICFYVLLTRNFVKCFYVLVLFTSSASCSPPPSLHSHAQNAISQIFLCKYGLFLDKNNWLTHHCLRAVSTVENKILRGPSPRLTDSQRLKGSVLRTFLYPLQRLSTMPKILHRAQQYFTFGP